MAMLAGSSPNMLNGGGLYPGGSGNGLSLPSNIPGQGGANGVGGPVNTVGSVGQGIYPSLPGGGSPQPVGKGVMGTNPGPQLQAPIGMQTNPGGQGQEVNGTPGSQAPGNDLLPGGFQQSDLGVGQQGTTVQSPQSYVQGAEGQMKGPTDWNVTPNETVAGQYASLMGEGGSPISPAVQQAEQAVIRSNAAHGGANDMMSTLSAQEAGSNVAMQVAQQDAATNASAGQYNATQANAFNTQINTLVDNAQLSRQNYDQALGTLNAQTNQQLQLLTANVNANAAETQTSLNASLKTIQANLQSTLTQMGQNFNYQTASQFNAAGIQNAQAWTNYGMNVRLNYLSGMSTQMNALQTEIANISANPNISSAQAQGAMSDAVNEFNTLMTQMGSYYSSMMPVGGQGSSGTTYNTPEYNYNVADSTTWPAPASAGSPTPVPPPVTAQGGGSSSSNFF